MKYLYLLIALLFSQGNEALAQEEQTNSQGRPTRYFEGIVTVGLNASQIDGDGLSGFNMPGAYVGVGARYVINSQWGFGPEFLYSAKGARTTLDDEGVRGIIHQKTRLQYVDFPILGYYTPASAERWTFEGGVVFSYLLKANIEIGDNAAVVTERWTKIDYSAIGGFEYKFSDQISAVARWTYSILPTNANYDYSDPQYSSIAYRGAGLRNSTISIAIRLHLHQALN